MLWFGEAALNPTHGAGLETRFSEDLPYIYMKHVFQKTYRTFTWNMWPINQQMANQGLRSHRLFSWRYPIQQDHIKKDREQRSEINNSWSHGAFRPSQSEILGQRKWICSEKLSVWRSLPSKSLAVSGQQQFHTAITRILVAQKNSLLSTCELGFSADWIPKAIHRNHLHAFPEA